MSAELIAAYAGGSVTQAALVAGGGLVRCVPRSLSTPRHPLFAALPVLGALLVEVTPPRWLGAGIAATAAVDLVLVASGLLTPASLALNSAGVTESLPQLQRVELGPLTMGYADLFLPALVGALLATRV